MWVSGVCIVDGSPSQGEGDGAVALFAWLRVRNLLCWCEVQNATPHTGNSCLIDPLFAPSAAVTSKATTRKDMHVHMAVPTRMISTVWLLVT